MISNDLSSIFQIQSAYLITFIIYLISMHHHSAILNAKLRGIHSVAIFNVPSWEAFGSCSLLAFFLSLFYFFDEWKHISSTSLSNQHFHCILNYCFASILIIKCFKTWYQDKTETWYTFISQSCFISYVSFVPWLRN